MTRLAELVGSARRLHELTREVRALREEVSRLRVQNERMRAGMRRCLTCDYRIQVEESRP